MNVCFQESIPVIDFFSQILQRFCSHHFINFPFVYDPLHIFPTDPAMSAYLPAAGLQNKDFPASPDEQIPMRQHEVPDADKSKNRSEEHTSELQSRGHLVC